MNFGIGQYHARPTSILYGELRLTIFTSNTADGAPQVLALQGFDVFYLECLYVQIVESEQCDGILDLNFGATD